MNKDFQEWCEWFDSHKEPDGSIDLTKHPDLMASFIKTYDLAYKRFKGVPDNSGDAVTFEFNASNNWYKKAAELETDILDVSSPELLP